MELLTDIDAPSIHSMMIRPKRPHETQSSLAFDHRASYSSESSLSSISSTRSS